MDAATWIGIAVVMSILIFEMIRSKKMDERMRAEEAKGRFMSQRERLIAKAKANWDKVQPHDAETGLIVSAEYAIDNPRKVTWEPNIDPAKIEKFEDEYVTNVVKLARRFRDSGWRQVEGFELTVFAVNGGCAGG
ncbi:MAG: hypothetical protein IT203_02670 [Fimbriimonadaceae bacterium]|nr:hypothetical protein [Fimbriimonadaceae bacterium]